MSTTEGTQILVFTGPGRTEVKHEVKFFQLDLAPHFVTYGQHVDEHQREHSVDAD